MTASTPSPPHPPRASPLATDQRNVTAGNRVRRWALHALATLHRWGEAGWSGPAAGLYALGQGAILPAPSEAVFMPLAVADARKALHLAAWALVGSVLGGCIAYAIGAGGLHVLAYVGIDPSFVDGWRGRIERQGPMLIFVGAFAPVVPMKLVNFAAGALALPFPTFALALLGGRAVRYAALGLAFRFAGEKLNARLRRTLGRDLDQIR